jgi:hypothetical protein
MTMTVAEKHQLKILKDTIRNPAKELLGGPTEREAEQMLKERFGYTNKQINNLRK